MNLETRKNKYNLEQEFFNKWHTFRFVEYFGFNKLDDKPFFMTYLLKDNRALVLNRITI